MRKHPFIFLLVIALTCTSCKKWQKQYPEDTERTKLTPTERLVGKWWVHAKTTVNNIDLTNSIKDSFGEYKLRFTTEDAGFSHQYGTFYSDLYAEHLSVWDFYNGESEIQISSSTQSAYNYILPCTFGSSIYGTYTYQILKLSETEFSIKLLSLKSDTTIINRFIAN